MHTKCFKGNLLRNVHLEDKWNKNSIKVVIRSVGCEVHRTGPGTCPVLGISVDPCTICRKRKRAVFQNNNCTASHESSQNENSGH
jgi:hypothetical protein